MISSMDHINIQEEQFSTWIRRHCSCILNYAKTSHFIVFQCLDSMCENYHEIYFVEKKVW